MSIILHYLNLANKTLHFNCDVFRAAALDTWHRIAFSRTKPGLKIHETTITQNLVYELNLLKEISPFISYKIFESRNERANGDDLEITIKHYNGRYYTFALQAKIIYHNLSSRLKGYKRLDDGVYERLNRPGGKGRRRRNQIDLLLIYSRTRGYIPLYLFYNFVSSNIKVQNLCSIDFNITQFGCSIVAAQYLKDNCSLVDGNLNKKVRFSNLHPSIALPLFSLPCCFNNYSLNEMFESLHIQKPDYEIKSFSSEEVRNDNEWIELKINNMQENKVVGTSARKNNNDTIEFIPKYKLIME